MAPALSLPVSSRFFRNAAVIFVAVLAAFVLAACLTPDPSYDGPAYHIPPINQWIVKGYIHEVSSTFFNSELMNGYPKGAEAVTFVFIQAFGGKMLTMLNLFYAPLGFCGIALLCHLFGAALRESLLFGACYLLVPGVALQYISTYVDSALAFSIVAMLALLTSSFFMAWGNWPAEALFVGCAIGNVIAVKGSGIPIVGVSLAVFLAFHFVDSRNDGRLRERLSATLGWIVIALLSSALIGGFWYIRNYVNHRSPIYPMGISVAGRPVFPGEPVAKVMDEVAQTPSEMLKLPAAIRVLISWLDALDPRQWNNDAVDRRLGGLGISWILGCVPAMFASIYFLLRRAIPNARLRVAAGFIAISVVLAFLETPMNWWARYVLWVFAFGLPAMWLVLGAARPSARSTRLAGFWVTGCVAVLLLQGATAATMRLRLAAVTLVRLKIGAHLVPTVTLRTGRPPLSWFPEMNSPLLSRILQTEAAIAIGPRALDHSTLLIYGCLSTEIGRHNLIPLAQDLTASDVARLAEEDHVRYILWLTSSPLPSSLAAHVVARGAEGPFSYLELILPISPAVHPLQ